MRQPRMCNRKRLCASGLPAGMAALCNCLPLLALLNVPFWAARRAVLLSETCRFAILYVPFRVAFGCVPAVARRWGGGVSARFALRRASAGAKKRSPGVAGGRFTLCFAISVCQCFRKSHVPAPAFSLAFVNVLARCRGGRRCVSGGRDRRRTIAVWPCCGSPARPLRRRGRGRRRWSLRPPCRQ